MIPPSRQASLRREQIEDEGLALVIQAMESGIEPDERVMGEEARAFLRQRSNYGWTQKES